MGCFVYGPSAHARACATQCPFLSSLAQGEVQRPSERKAMQMAGQDGFMPPYGGGDMYGACLTQG